MTPSAPRMSRRRPRAGFGIYYLISMVVLLGLGAVTMAGLSLQRQGARNEQHLNRSLRAAGESYMALALGLVQDWANAEGGPTVPETGTQLYKTFRQFLMDPALVQEAVHLEFDLAAELGVPLDWEGTDRYQLREGKVRVTVHRPALFEGYTYHGGGKLLLEALVLDRTDHEPPLLFTRSYRYTVTSPTVPPPFDRLVLAIQDPESLLGNDRDGDIRRFTDRIYTVNRRFNRSIERLEDVRQRLSVLPGAIDVSPLERALEALRGGRPDPRTIDFPPHNPVPVAQVLVAYPGVGTLPLEKLVVKERIDEIKRQLVDLEAAWEAIEARIDAATTAALQPPFDLSGLEPPVRDWTAAAALVWAKYQQGLDVYNDLDELKIRFKPQEPLAPHWSQFDLEYWRRKAHYRLENAPTEELATKLKELAEAVRPLNGIVYVDNDPEDPSTRLVLTEGGHGLVGRFVLAVRGQVVLEGFRPQEEAASTGSDRSRALVVAGGDALVRGRNQVALYGHRRLSLAPGSVLQGGLYARTILDPGELAPGVLEVLEDEDSTHRFRARQSAAVFRDSHLLVAIDPVASRKNVE